MEILSASEKTIQAIHNPQTDKQNNYYSKTTKQQENRHNLTIFSSCYLRADCIPS